jgi:hypothetical protein
MPANLRLAASFMRRYGMYADRFDSEAQAMLQSRKWMV